MTDQWKVIERGSEPPDGHDRQNSSSTSTSTSGGVDRDLHLQHQRQRQLLHDLQNAQDDDVVPNETSYLLLGQSTSPLSNRTALVDNRHTIVFSDEHVDDFGNDQQHHPQRPPRYCRAQPATAAPPRHPFENRTLTIERTSSMITHHPDEEGKEENNPTSSDKKLIFHPPTVATEHMHDPGMSTPSTLTESAGIDHDPRVIDEYEEYLNYYQNQGRDGEIGGGLLTLFPGGGYTYGSRAGPRRSLRILATLTILGSMVLMATLVGLLGSLARRGYSKHQYDGGYRGGDGGVGRWQHPRGGHSGGRTRGASGGASSSSFDLFEGNEIMSSAGFVYATDLADDATTLMELAGMMLPPWYDLSVAQCDLFTAKIMPWEVFAARKILLKTRDLVDALGPVYPNRTRVSSSDGAKKNTRKDKRKKNRKKSPKKEDFLEELRWHLNRGYTRVGDFQDLHASRVIYNQHQLEYHRNRVLSWKKKFLQFQQTHDVARFLSHPSPGCYDRSGVRSHLFWGEAGLAPCGSDPATRTLALLGSRQLDRALGYLRPSLALDSVTTDPAQHELYHNLRKELRSIYDEYELFGSVMFGSSDSADRIEYVVDMIKAARKKLGDINDDYTAYSIYVKEDKYPQNQDQLAKKIEGSWNEFKSWAVQFDLEGNLLYLADTMKQEARNDVVPLKQFLQQMFDSPTKHVVIGNVAGDADSIISAITLAYIESATSRKMSKTPVVSIAQENLATQRPEVVLLLELVGITDPSSILLFNDSPSIKNGPAGIDATLVDHNRLDQDFDQRTWRVTEIVDHHSDEGLYQDTCSGAARTIAYQGRGDVGSALVSSTCTLVAEKLTNVWKGPLPGAISILLLGTILLDSVNLSPDAGKVTQRDVDAVHTLLNSTRWIDLSLSRHSQALLHINETMPMPDPDYVFDLLQGAKYSKSFWRSLPVRDALRYDYKAFAKSEGVFGVATILMPLENFFAKHKAEAGISHFMEKNKLDFLAIMFASQPKNRTIRRQLSLCGMQKMNDAALLSRIAAHLQNIGLEQGSLLRLEEISSYSTDGVTIKNYNQNNTAPSRKQIGPMLESYFSSRNPIR